MSVDVDRLYALSSDDNLTPSCLWGRRCLGPGSVLKAAAGKSDTGHRTGGPAQQIPATYRHRFLSLLIIVVNEAASLREEDCIAVTFLATPVL